MNTNKIIMGLIGAAVLVIVGALMKIEHVAFAEVVLAIGLILQILTVVMLVRAARKK